MRSALRTEPDRCICPAHQQQSAAQHLQRWPGILDAIRKRVFEPLSRLETSRDKASVCYGLGLAIATRILQRHNGTIHVDNCAPHGACFKLEWPRGVQAAR